MITRRTAMGGGGLITLAAMSGCAGRAVSSTIATGPAATYEQFTADFTKFVDLSEPGEILAVGYQWAEGPAWDKQRQTLYFTDVPANLAYAWSRDQGVRTFLNPSGVSADQAVGFREPGANGLLISKSGDLLLCNHGARAVQSLDLTSGKRKAIATQFEGRKFNSPNDVIEAENGTLFFTDPPYGFEGLNDSPLKEMSVNGVYRRETDGAITRIVADMTFPNGIALSPDQSHLYIAQSDPDAPLVRRFRLSDMSEDNMPWFDARPYTKDQPGLPDGLAIATTGHVFLAGPGGVLVIDPEGTCLGRISTGRATANCTFGEDGYTLFITAQNRLLRLQTKAMGVGRF